MSTKPGRWGELSPGTRRLIVSVGVLDAGLRVWALADLKRRHKEDLRGPKLAWGLALTLVSSAGVVPATYLLLGRRRARD